MNRSRVTISTLAAVVAVVAVNLAAGRALIADQTMLCGVGLLGLSLQVAFLQLLRCRERSRAFWRGFLLAGTATLVLFTWGLSRPDQRIAERWELERFSRDWNVATRTLVFWACRGRDAAELFQPSPGRAYIERDQQGPVLGCLYWEPNHRTWVVMTGACGVFATQLSMSIGGGLLTHWFTGMRRRAQSPA